MMNVIWCCHPIYCTASVTNDNPSSSHLHYFHGTIILSLFLKHEKNMLKLRDLRPYDVLIKMSLLYWFSMFKFWAILGVLVSHLPSMASAPIYVWYFSLWDKLWVFQNTVNLFGCDNKYNEINFISRITLINMFFKTYLRTKNC